MPISPKKPSDIIQQIDVEIDNEKPKPKLIRRIFDFVVKHKIAFIIATVIIAILATLYALLPVVSIDNKFKLVGLDTVVRLEIGQTARLKDRNVSAGISHFTNDSCPDGQVCFGSGKTVQSVEYELFVGSQKFIPNTTIQEVGAGYQIETVSTDYKTYAEIKIIQK